MKILYNILYWIITILSLFLLIPILIYAIFSPDNEEDKIRKKLHPL